MSTYLQLVNATLEKCGATSSVTAVTGNPMDTQRFCTWVNDAYMDILGMYENWQFMRTTFTFPTVTHVQAYTPTQAGATNFGNWKVDSFRIRRTAIGYGTEIWLPYEEYEAFRNLYQFGAMRTSYQQPVLFSLDPSKNILLGPAPDTISYTVEGEYYSVPTELVAASDTPVLPTQYHRAIMYRAMMFYGVFEAAGEIFQMGQSEFNRLISRLELDQLPDIDLGGPLL